MDVIRLTSTKDTFFAEMFQLYQTSFPKHEQRPADKQAALMVNPRYHCNALVEADTLAGILLYWKCSGYSYIEHFAIHPSMRGRATGSKVLATFCENHSPVVLEIDPPVDAIAIRRESFYQRLGFQRNGYAHAHPAYQAQFPPHELTVMSYPKHMTEKEYLVFQRELGEIVMKDADA